MIHAATKCLAAEGSEYITLGLSPISRHVAEEMHGNPFWLRWLLTWIARTARRFYNFEGLDTFKRNSARGPGTGLRDLQPAALLPRALRNRIGIHGWKTDPHRNARASPGRRARAHGLTREPLTTSRASKTRAREHLPKPYNVARNAQSGLCFSSRSERNCAAEKSKPNENPHHSNHRGDLCRNHRIRAGQATRAAPGGKGGHRPNPEEVFKKLDANGDGSVSLDEFKAGPRAPKEADKAQEIFGKIDKDGNGSASLEEFKAHRPPHGPGGRPPGGGGDAGAGGGGPRPPRPPRDANN